MQRLRIHPKMADYNMLFLIANFTIKNDMFNRIRPKKPT